VVVDVVRVVHMDAPLVVMGLMVSREIAAWVPLLDSEVIVMGC
jgi:hypothetical protein